MEVIVSFDVLRGVLQFEPRMRSAAFARRKLLAKNAGDFVWLSMLLVMGHGINARSRHSIPWFENVTYVGHDSSNQLLMRCLIELDPVEAVRASYIGCKW